MRRASAIAVVALALCAACGSSTQRPEGVVERWLLSLDQGAAGEPERFGGELAVGAADAVLPDRQTRDPGSLDRVEVGAADVTGEPGSQGATVPFRIETVDGDVVVGVVEVGGCGGDDASGGQDWCVRDVRLGGDGPSPGAAWSPGADGSDWARAGVVAVVLASLAVGAVVVVNRSSASRAT
jgi:hypothetical protein